MPPRVEYQLTPLGRQTSDRLKDLVHFLEGQMQEVVAAQTRYDEVGPA
jgi:DNA-binding HxlR family transcriptional regulator